jgi:hypothetical protein
MKQERALAKIAAAGSAEAGWKILNSNPPAKADGNE